MRPIRCRPLAVGFEIFQRGPSSIRDFFVLNGLTLIQSSQAGPFDRQEMHKDVSSTVLRPNESVSFFRIEPLHRATCHLAAIMHDVAHCLPIC
jgi:hypothetical protein